MTLPENIGRSSGSSTIYHEHRSTDNAVVDRSSQIPLSLAVEYGHVAVVKMLVEKGTAVELVDTHYGAQNILTEVSRLMNVDFPNSQNTRARAIRHATNHQLENPLGKDPVGQESPASNH